jgi:hypothetical protein
MIDISMPHRSRHSIYFQGENRRFLLWDAFATAYLVHPHVVGNLRPLSVVFSPIKTVIYT